MHKIAAKQIYKYIKKPKIYYQIKKGFFMDAFKNKYESKGETRELSKQTFALSQRSEENKSLLRKNSKEKQAGLEIRKNDNKNPSKAEKISLGVGLAGLAAVVGSLFFSVAATATGVLSPAAVAIYGPAMLVTGLAMGISGLWGSFVLEKLSKKKQN